MVDIIFFLYYMMNAANWQTDLCEFYAKRNHSADASCASNYPSASMLQCAAPNEAINLPAEKKERKLGNEQVLLSTKRHRDTENTCNISVRRGSDDTSHDECNMLRRRRRDVLNIHICVCVCVSVCELCGHIVCSSQFTKSPWHRRRYCTPHYISPQRK